MTNAQRKLSLYTGAYALLLGVVFSSAITFADEAPATPVAAPVVRARTLPNAGFFVERDEDGNTIQGGKRQYIIPASELATHYIKGFRVETFEDETGAHIKIHGFMPRECTKYIEFSQVKFSSNPDSYKLSVTGVDAPGEPAGSWQACFNRWYTNNNRCPRDGSCVDIEHSDVAGLSAVQSFELDKSGPVKMVTESSDETGHPTEVTVATFTSAADLERAEKQEQLAALCNTARTGRRSDINALREFGIENNLPNAVAAADSFLRDLEARAVTAREAELTALIESISEVDTIAEARAKLRAIVRAGSQNRSARVRLSEALMTLATKVNDIEPAEGESVPAATMAKFNTIDAVLAAAKRMGNHNTTARRNQNALARYVYAVRTPEVDGTAYAAARQSAETAVREAGLAGLRETGMEHPNRDFAQAGAQFFGWQRDAHGNPVFGAPSASDGIANYARQQAQATRARVDYYNTFQNSGVR